MPITASAKKALRQSIRRHARNLTQNKELKNTVKSYKKLVAAKKIDEAKKQLASVYQVLDKGAKNNLMKKNTASRLKSRLTKLLKVK
ncbi:MAG: 30S ribosomal protein S20 [Patescibacteria group bacterium]